MTNIVYIIMHAIQFLTFVSMGLLVYHIYKQKSTSKQRLLLVIGISMMMYNYGYCEALSTAAEQSMQWAVRIQYISELMFLTCMLQLLLEFCDMSLKKIHQKMIWSVNIFFLLLLLLEEYTGLMFCDYTYKEAPLAVQAQFVTLPLGYVFFAYMMVLAIACLYVGVIIRQNQQKERVVTVLAVMTTLPLLAFVLCMAGVTGGFDFGPILGAVTVWMICGFDKNYHLLDNGEIARETILDEVGEGYIVLDRERKVKAYNSIAAMLYPELEHPEDSEVMVELIYLHNHDVLEHNGKMCDVVVSELKDDSDLVGYVMWVYDRTDEYYCMRELQQLRDQAHESDRTRDFFLQHMTHGFGSPLQIIKNRSAAVYQDERASEDVREMIQEILEAGQKLEDMVGVMKEYTMESVGGFDRQEDEYLTADLLKNLQSQLENRRQGRCQDVRLSVGLELPVRWFGDRNGIEEVVQGMLRCAGIAAKIGAMELKLASEMRYADALLIVTLWLDDHGVTTSELNRLAAKVQKGDKNLDAEVNYIPYSLCRRCLLEMKGSMECSVEMEKSKVVLSFPQRIVDNTPYGAANPLANDGGQNVMDLPSLDGSMALAGDDKQPTVMVVDDNILYLREMDSWLRKLHLKTIVAKNGAECLRILEKKRVDMIFMDQMMPGMDGTQALEEVRKLEKSKGIAPVPVVLLTADDTVGARRRYIESGFDDYLAKPIEPQQICQQVQKHLGLEN